MTSGARIVLFGVVLCVASCGGALSHAPPRRAPPTEAPPSLAPAVGALALPPVAPLYEDPRFAGLRDKELAKDFEGAMRLVSDARKAASDDPRAKCAWAYVEGRLAAAAGLHGEALTAFDVVGEVNEPVPGCGLGAYGKLRGAQSAAKLGQWDGVLARLASIPPDFLLAAERVVAESEAQLAKGDRAKALAPLRAQLAKEPLGPRWVDSSAKVAGALLDGVFGDAKAGAREAYDLATRILVSAPKFAEPHGARELRSRAAALLGDAALPAALTADEKAKVVQSWLDGSEPKRAAQEADAAFQSEGAKATCKLALVRAQAHARAKSGAAAELAWTDAIARCEGAPELANALFGGGKAASSKRPDEAKARFLALEEKFPKNRLADDARLLRATLERDGGDEAKSAALLLALPDDFPDGDMRADGLFRVALERMRRGDYAAAKAPLERTLALGLPPRNASVARAAYYLARVDEEAGDREGARTRYVRVVEEHPLTFYMLAALRRLREVDAGFAERTLAAAEQRGENAPWPPPHGLDPSGVARAARLLEVGEIDPAKRELARAGLKEGTEVAAAFGALFSRAGAYDVGVNMARRGDLFASYPNGRWRALWEAAFPKAYDGLVRAEAKKNGIPVSLAFGIMREESMFVADAKSVANAFGLMQLILPTAKLVAQGTGLPFDEPALKRADVNVALGTRLLGQLRTSLGEARLLSPAAYNAGAGAVGRWRGERRGEPFDLFVEAIPFEETRNYQKRVLGSQATYALLYDREELAELYAMPLRAP